MNSDAPTQPAGEPKANTEAQIPDRRRFLEIGLWTSVGVAGLAFMGTGGRFVVGDALSPQQEQWVQVGEVAKLPAGQVHRATYTARTKDAWRSSERKGLLYVSSDDGANYTVLDGTCTHLGCNVKWTDENQGFHCPCHPRAVRPQRRSGGWPGPQAAGAAADENRKRRAVRTDLGDSDEQHARRDYTAAGALDERSMVLDDVAVDAGTRRGGTGSKSVPGLANSWRRDARLADAPVRCDQRTLRPGRVDTGQPAVPNAVRLPARLLLRPERGRCLQQRRLHHVPGAARLADPRGPPLQRRRHRAAGLCPYPAHLFLQHLQAAARDHLALRCVPAAGRRWALASPATCCPGTRRATGRRS